MPAVIGNAAEQQVGEDKEATESLVYAMFLLAGVAPGRVVGRGQMSRPCQPGNMLISPCSRVAKTQKVKSGEVLAGDRGSRRCSHAAARA